MDVGIEFSNYRVLEHIGRGGMADVWSARDKRLGRTVAIKTVARDLSMDVDPIKLFEREAQTIAGLEHPHILPIYEFGEYSGQLYIVMRYVSGGSLEDVVEKGPLPLDEVLRHGRHIAQALDHAHNNKIIHLDLKPSNILLDSNDVPYLADFGLAAMLDPEGRAANPGSGTLLYMAPEQFTADVLDHKVDVYSFSILLFHLLTGQLPFDAFQPLALRQIQFHDSLPPIEEIAPNLPYELTDVLRTGTAVDPSQRPERVSELVAMFEEIVRPNKRGTSELSIITADAPESEADLSDMITQPSTAEAQAKREAQDIYNRARRAWAHGQGRFLLGVTHFTLINDFYRDAERHHLEMDEAGTQMLLRGALEYDTDIDYWWGRLDDDSRRWVSLHAARSENAPARVRALQRLTHLPDADLPIIPRAVAQLLQVETSEAALLAGLDTLAARAQMGHKRASIEMLLNNRTLNRTTQIVQMITQQFTTPNVWEDVIFSQEIDLLLAEMAVSAPYASVRDLAARTVGRMYSLVAVRQIARQQREGVKGALRALALIRDEAPSLPPEVSQQGRLYAWLANTYRRLSDDPLALVRRFLLALLGALLGIGLNTYLSFRAESIFTPARWGTTISIGLTCGVLVAFMVILADELPARLGGFWKWWARAIWSVGLGLLTGTLVWRAYTYLYLEYIPNTPVIAAGVGLALGFVAASLFSLPGWLAFIVTAAATYAPLYYYAQGWLLRSEESVVYYDTLDHTYSLLLPMCILIALGGHAPRLWRSWRAFRARRRAGSAAASL